MAITQLPPLSLYVHTPWCVQKCPYCDFNSHQLKEDIPEEEYINRLLFDLEQELPSVWGRQLTSIFIGGGTPSLFSPESIDKLICGIRALLPFHSDMEITMEANPGTVEANNFIGFRKAGINRISLGVQSFNDSFLKSLGRIHNAHEAEKAFSIARKAGFDNINIDLMYALPGQSVTQAIDDLRKAVSLSPEHLSWYQLTLEPNTYFYQYPPPLPNDDLIIDMSEQGLNWLEKNHYSRYEVSAFSRSNSYPSQHNLNYWQFGDYLGIGAGAHQKITRADNQTIVRKSKYRNPKDYLNQEKETTVKSHEIRKEELPLEFMMNALRLKQGVSEELFFNTTGLLIGQLQKSLVEAESRELLIRENNNIRASEKGYQFLNELLQIFMPENYPELAEEKTIAIKSIV